MKGLFTGISSIDFNRFYLSISLHRNPQSNLSQLKSLTLSYAVENSTGRSQYNFPASAPLPPPGQRPFAGARHGVHASISGPVSSSPNGFTRQPLSAYGAPRIPGTGLGPGVRPAIPPYNPAGQQQQQSQAPPAPPDQYNQQQQQQPSQPFQQPQPTAPPVGMSNTPPPPALSPTQDLNAARAARPGRRQYARDTSAYIAGDLPPGAGGSMPTGGGSGHGHSQSTAGFFSPAAPAINDPNAANGGGGAGQFFSPGAPTPGGQPNEFVPPGAGAPVPGAVGGGAPVAPGGAGGYGGGVQQLGNQFGQMGLGGNATAGGPRQQANPATVDLIKTPLNPLELMTMNPPEIRLPPNVRFLTIPSFSFFEGIADTGRIVTGFLLSI